MVPAVIASALDLTHVTRFLDVGTGVGLLAVAITALWPEVLLSGSTRGTHQLSRQARANVDRAGLETRITLRRQNLGGIDDVDAFDCIWIPSFFLSETDLKEGLAAATRALRPGGWIVLGRMRPAPDPVAEATCAADCRGGGSALDTKSGYRLAQRSLAALQCTPRRLRAPRRSSSFLVNARQLGATSALRRQSERPQLAPRRESGPFASSRPKARHIPLSLYMPLSGNAHPVPAERVTGDYLRVHGTRPATIASHRSMTRRRRR